MVLKKEYLDQIKKDPKLFSEVAICLNKKPSYMLQLLNYNDPMLTQASVLEILKQAFKVKQYSDLVTQLQEVA